MLSAMISLPSLAVGRTFCASGIERPWNRMPFKGYTVRIEDTFLLNELELTSFGSSSDPSQSIAFNPRMPPITFSTCQTKSEFL